MVPNVTFFSEAKEGYFKTHPVTAYRAILFVGDARSPDHGIKKKLDLFGIEKNDLDYKILLKISNEIIIICKPQENNRININKRGHLAG